MKPRIEIFKSKTSKHPWYFRIKGKNGEIIAQSEGYTSEAKARKGLAALLGAAFEYVWENGAQILNCFKKK